LTVSYERASEMKHRINAGDLQVGMPLRFDVFDSSDRLLLRRGNRITSAAQLGRLINEGVFYHAPSDREDARSDDGTELVSARTRVAREVSTFKILDDCSRRLAVLLDRPARTSEADSFFDEIMTLVRRIQRCCQFDGDAALAYVLLGQVPRYTLRQHMNVAILTGLMLSRMASVRTDAALAAALTMNIGMLVLQEELYWTSDPLGPDQRAALHQHPDMSVLALRERGVRDPAWLEIVAQHHEALDGSGYPRGIDGVEIAREARVIAVADRYNGMVMNRAYRPGMAPDQALKELARRDASALDPEILGLLIRAIGVYPPGTVVALVNKEVGVVTKRLLDLKHPIVRTFFLESHWPYDKPAKRFTSRMPQFAIANVLPRDALAYPIDPEQLWPPSPFVESVDEAI
jgi:HD-GYP domain-containing protein (c-di-GMP phosphodiesterase class II)